ncbi:hypothetical protein [Pseudoclavibacter sp. 8L]|uniref:hypothetical protein n=1 Tax=Pseudoclavibacter sp. 8L TaxID=2653162 RepID=UPI00135AACC8|nr:hypothetical protein [Pseudoclavibacter sp. 8L]
MLSQVVLSPSSDGRVDLHISALVAGKKHDGRELHLGSQDLIRFAAYATTHGANVTSFMLADPYLAPIDPDEEGAVSDEMVRILREYGGSELVAAMGDEFEGMYVVGVDLISPTDGLHLSLRRRGFVETSVVQAAEVLLADAWRELHLS